ncbi:MAG: HD domain-containing protein [Candidatus Dormibacteraeota bacterium]|nr:HD domain-containing protein [Candidatus Dormibacteraeota bacterium]
MSRWFSRGRAYPTEDGTGAAEVRVRPLEEGLEHLKRLLSAHYGGEARLTVGVVQLAVSAATGGDSLPESARAVVGEVITRELRGDDILSIAGHPDRYLVILPGTEPEIAARVLRRIEDALRRALAPELDGRALYMFSGLAPDGRNARVDDLVRSATDTLLYEQRLAWNARAQGISPLEERDDAVETAEAGYVATRVVVRTLLQALESHSPTVAAHGRRVADLALALAADTGFPPGDFPILRAAALLHDVGMLGIAPQVLGQGIQGHEDAEELRMHPRIGYELLRGIAWTQTAAVYVREHHEAFDGSGYPVGLVGKEISLGARLIAVAESYDYLVAAGTGGAGTAPGTAVKAMRAKGAGKFDPLLLAALHRHVKRLPKRAPQ